MNRVGNFEKVSFEQFYTAMKEEFYEYMIDRTEDLSQRGEGYKAYADLIDDLVFQKDVRLLYDAIKLPTRATSGSAGYDFKAPFTFTLTPGKTIKIPTGIRVKIDEGWWLGCLPRSGLGFKYRLGLANTFAVVDSDYYYSDNEGHIFLKVFNGGDKTFTVEAGDGFAQALFLPYGITYDDAADGVRNGGMGSTDKK